jgi:hypothetical protein
MRMDGGTVLAFAINNISLCLIQFLLLYIKTNNNNK